MATEKKVSKKGASSPVSASAAGSAVSGGVQLSTAGQAAEKPGIVCAAESISDVERFVASYNPLKSKFPLCSADEWVLVGPVVRSTVLKLEGFSPRGLRPYLSSMTKLSTWALREGLPLEVEVLFSPKVVDAFALSLPASHGTFRSALRRLARANGVEVETTGVEFARPVYTDPYSLDDVRALLTFAGSLSNMHRKRTLTGVVLLGAGCGFARKDLRDVCRKNVHRHNQVLHVAIHDRCTPVLDVLVDDFEAFLGWCGDEPFVGVNVSNNITDRLATWVGDRAGVPRFRADRLRAFFVVELVRRNTGVSDLLSWGGFAGVEALRPYFEFVDLPNVSCDAIAEGVS